MTVSLLFCKAKVFIHPSKSITDNVPGFLLITVGPNTTKHDAELSWIPESILNPKQLDWLNNADLTLVSTSTNTKTSLEMDNSILTEGVGNYLAFSTKVSYLYSIEFRRPSPSGWWFGSVIMHTRDSRDGASIPILFFHDDICPSTLKKQKELNKSFDPFTVSGDIYWGGSDFRDEISNLVDLQKTFVDPTVWLVNATLDDLRNFSSFNQSLKNIADDKHKEDSKEDFWSRLESTRWSVMSRIADVTSKTGSIVNNLIRKHPVVQFVERNDNNKYVKLMMENPKVQEIQNDLDSARIYLAKWALGVQEEADRYQQSHNLTDTYRRILTNDLGFDISEDTHFSDLELNTAMQRNFPLTRQKWESFFDAHGRLAVTVNEVKESIFYGCVDSMELRKEIWPFLLKVYPWDSSADERLQIKEGLIESYNELKNRWLNKDILREGAGPDDEEEEYLKDQILRIEKDVSRNDRHIDIYKHNTIDGKKSIGAGELSEEGDGAVESETNGHWDIKNPHLLKLKEILITYNIYNSNLGYVQGMTDLLSPIYYVIRDDALSFWCFSNFMERMERNFLRDQAGIRDQMITMTELCQLMLPKLSKHLASCDSSNLFFCFRMLLVWFKREFEFQDICSIWEIFFTDYYSSQFQLFFMLAILQKNSMPVIQNLNQFDQVLKYFNDMHEQMDWNDLMIRSELLFIRFQKMMNIMQRQTELVGNHNTFGTSVTTGVQIHDNVAENNKTINQDKAKLPSTSKYLQLLLSKEVIVHKEGPRTKDSIR